MVETYPIVSDEEAREYLELVLEEVKAEVVRRACDAILG